MTRCLMTKKSQNCYGHKFYPMGEKQMRSWRFSHKNGRFGPKRLVISWEDEENRRGCLTNMISELLDVCDGTTGEIFWNRSGGPEEMNNYGGRDANGFMQQENDEDFIRKEVGKHKRWIPTEEQS